MCSLCNVSPHLQPNNVLRTMGTYLRWWNYTIKAEGHTGPCVFLLAYFAAYQKEPVSKWKMIAPHPTSTHFCSFPPFPFFLGHQFPFGAINKKLGIQVSGGKMGKAPRIQRCPENWILPSPEIGKWSNGKLWQPFTPSGTALMLFGFTAPMATKAFSFQFDQLYADKIPLSKAPLWVWERGGGVNTRYHPKFRSK